MNEYGVIQLGGYLLSLPGAFLYLSSMYLAIRLAWLVSGDENVKHFRLTKFSVFGMLFISSVVLLWIQLGVWFYVKA
jgi:hypothetical protein